MNRTMRMAICVALATLLVAPAAAFAGKPESTPGRASAPGQVKKATGESGDVVVDADSDGDADAGKGRSKDKRKDGDNGKEARERGDNAFGSDEASGTADRKRVGIENALSRVQRNVDRAETRIEAGTAGAVPPGLMRVLEKFLGWLGLANIVEVDEGPDPDPAGETTTTMEPTGTIEPTSTPEVDPAPEPATE